MFFSSPSLRARGFLSAFFAAAFVLVAVGASACDGAYSDGGGLNAVATDASNGDASAVDVDDASLSAWDSPPDAGAHSADSGAQGAGDASVATSARVLLGAYSDTFSTLSTTVQSVSGRKIAIENQRETWGTNFGQADEQYDLTNGIIPMISWAVAYKDSATGDTCASYQNIMNGTYDNTWTDSGGATYPGLRQEADIVKAMKVPFMIRFYKEFTDTADDACFYGTSHPTGDPQLYGPMLVDIWQHVVDIFKSEGASNVQWIWGPSANLFGGGAPDDVTWRYFYPGSNYLDWISNDNYNKSDTVLEDYSTDPNIQNWYTLTSSLGKPLMQAETGAGYNSTLTPDPMTDWINTAYSSVVSRPAMKAFVWWSAEGQVDYDLQGAGLTTYETMSADPTFQATDVSAYFTSAGNASGPSTPTGVSAKTTNADVTISWNASTDTLAAISFYNVYRDAVAIGTSTTASYVDTSAGTGASHSYSVDAVDADFNRSRRSGATLIATGP